MTTPRRDDFPSFPNRNDPPPTRTYDTRWGWFAAILGAQMCAGAALAWFLMLPLGMATDGCHEGDTAGVCGLDAAGQNLLVFTPWLWFAVATVAALAAAIVAARFDRSPLLEIPGGLVAYVVMIPLGNVLVHV